MPPSLSRLPFSRIFRQLEQDMETVVKVLQPGPLGIIERKFTAEEIRRANSTVERAVENWCRTALIEQNNPILKDFIDTKSPNFIPFSVDDLSKSMEKVDVADVEPPPLLRENSGFVFFHQRSD